MIKADSAATCADGGSVGADAVAPSLACVVGVDAGVLVALITLILFYFSTLNLLIIYKTTQINIE